MDYAKLLDVFWHNVDPLDAGGQFCDRGSQYRSAIFAGDAKEQKLAEESKVKLAERFGKSIATDVRSAGPFYAAEEYHQDYYRKNPLRYQLLPRRLRPRRAPRAAVGERAGALIRAGRG